MSHKVNHADLHAAGMPDAVPPGLIGAATQVAHEALAGIVETKASQAEHAALAETVATKQDAPSADASARALWAERLAKDTKDERIPPWKRRRA